MKNYSDEEIKRYPLPKEKLYNRYIDVYKGINENRFVTLIGMSQSGRSGFFMASKDQCKDTFEDCFNFHKNIFISISALYKKSSSNEYREFITNSLLKHLSITDQSEVKSYLESNKIETALRTSISKLQSNAKENDIKYILIIWGLDELIQLNPEHTYIYNEIFVDLSYSELEHMNIMFVVSPATLYSEHCTKLHRYLNDYKVIFSVLDSEEIKYNCKRQELLKNLTITNCDKYKELTGGHFGHYMHLFAGDFSDKDLKDIKYLQESQELVGGIKLLHNSIDINSKAQVKLAQEMGYLNKEGKFIAKLMQGSIKVETSEPDLKLTPQQEEILNYLKENRDIVVTREEIAKHIWGDLWSIKYSDWALDKQISIIRKAIKPKGQKVKAVRGKGIKFVIED